MPGITNTLAHYRVVGDSAIIAAMWQRGWPRWLLCIATRITPVKLAIMNTMPLRERVASLLFRTGALSAVMRARGVAKVPLVSIYTFHHIADHHPDYLFDPGVADASPVQFRRQLEMLLRWANPISLDDLLAALDGQPLPANPVMITFDDGYASNYHTALPILASLGVPATFFIATKFINERRLFWWETLAWTLKQSQRATLQLPTNSGDIVVDQLPRRTFATASPTVLRELTDLVKNTPHMNIDAFVQAIASAADVEWTPTIEHNLADDLLLTWDQLRSMVSQGMAVGSHTHSHRVLQTVPIDELQQELAGSKTMLQQQLGCDIHAIAYPVGRRIEKNHVVRSALQQAGYRIGFTNASGVNMIAPPTLRQHFAAADPFDVRRLATDRTMSDAMFVAQMALPQFAYIYAGNL